MFRDGDPGDATVQALRRLRLGAMPATNGHGGNGAAMRAHPIGCLRDRQTVLQVAAIQEKSRTAPAGARRGIDRCSARAQSDCRYQGIKRPSQRH
jgi:ADP-ribosylglycohydrolase